MQFDARDVLTVAFASGGLLLGSLVAFALRSEFVIGWSLGGLLLGSGFAAYFLSSGGK